MKCEIEEMSHSGGYLKAVFKCGYELQRIWIDTNDINNHLKDCKGLPLVECVICENGIYEDYCSIRSPKNLKSAEGVKTICLDCIKICKGVNDEKNNK